MDTATILGILSAVSLMFWVILSSASLGTFYDFSSILCTCGGTLAALVTCVPPGRLGAIFKVTRNAFVEKTRDPQDLIREIVGYAEIARRDGILSLENTTKDIEDPFVVSGIQMAVDGMDPDHIQQIMNSELDALADRHAEGKSLFEAIAKYAPAYGMIGTLIGMVIMLKNMTDPSQIGHGMAVAILTTLYGIWIANIVAIPIADKLGRRSEEEIFLKSIVICGIMAIQAGDNPRIVERRLRTFVPSARRGNTALRPAERRAA